MIIQQSSMQKSQHSSALYAKYQLWNFGPLILSTTSLWVCAVYNPGIGNWVVRVSTLLCKSDTRSIKGKSGDVTNFMKSRSFDPETDFFASRDSCTPSWMKSAVAMNSFSENPLVVIAGDPMRMPPGTRALLSPVILTFGASRIRWRKGGVGGI